MYSPKSVTVREMFVLRSDSLSKRSLIITIPLCFERWMALLSRVFKIEEKRF